MARWVLTRLGRSPSHAETLIELDHMVLADRTPGERHGEHVADSADPLPWRRSRQVVVAIPAWLLSRVSDELEDPRGRDRNLPAGADDTHVIVTGHRPIEAHATERKRATGTRPRAFCHAPFVPLCASRVPMAVDGHPP